jgi:hypothetical protein
MPVLENPHQPILGTCVSLVSVVAGITCSSGLSSISFVMLCGSSPSINRLNTSSLCDTSSLEGNAALQLRVASLGGTWAGKSEAALEIGAEFGRYPCGKSISPDLRVTAYI